MDEQIKLQKTSTEHLKRQDSPCSSTNYEQNEEAGNFQRKSATHEEQKGVSMFVTTKKSSQLQLDAYKKRAGCIDLGKDYEKLMCALLALKFSTSDIVTDFEMKTNGNDCGDFDDVVLTVTFVDGESQTFLLELKHSESGRNVTDKNFAAENGDFNLRKYVKSIRKFENTENISFILYTNSSTNIEDGSKICLQNKDNTNEKLVVKELEELDDRKLLLWTKNEKTETNKNNTKEISPKLQAQKKGINVFQFELNQNSGLHDSFKRFYFFADQINTTGAESVINTMLREECGINDATCSSSFVQFIGIWWSGNFILTKYDVVAKLAELTLTPFIQTISDRKCTTKSNLLREAIMKFDMTIVRNTNEEVIANIWNDTASDDEISRASLKYGLRSKGIKDLIPKERSKVLWHLNKIPLIVKAEEYHEAQVKHAIRLLERIEKKKVVLLGNATKEEFPGWTIFQDLSDLPNKDVYKDIIQYFEVSLQGRPSIFLDQLLNFDRGNCRTIETTELIKMTQEVIEIGRRQENEFENYIPRSVSTMKSEERCIDEMEMFTYFAHRLNVICSPPGMGKSTLMSRLSSNCPSSYWSVHVNLINHKRVLKTERHYNKILQHFVQEEKDALAVNIRSMLLQNKRMYFFLDGLDEIDSDCLQIVLDFIKYISSLGHRVWITSREHLEQLVSKELNIFPIKVEELTEKEQKTYIEKRLQDMYQKDEIEHITNKIYANVDIVNSRHLIGIPLQLFMVTENFRDNKDLWREPDQEIFVLTKMYKKFFQGKKMHQLRKVGMHEHEDHIGFDFDLYLEQYELLALKSCLATRTFDKLKINLGKSQKFLEKLKTGDPFGIVSRVTDDNQAIFNHQTYAEYFACTWLTNNLNKVSLLQDDLFTEENKNLKFMFDIMLAENSALHMAVIYGDTNLILKHLDKSEVKDHAGRSPLQLLCTYGVKHPLLQVEVEPSFFCIRKKYYNENNTEEVSTHYREIFKMLLQCDVFQKDDVFQWDCLDYAVRLSNLFAVENLLERSGNSISLKNLFKHNDNITLAYYSSQMGYPNLLRAVIRKNSKVLSARFGDDDLTLLHVVIKGIKNNNKIAPSLMDVSIQVITTLIESGLDVDGKCVRNKTALHYASEIDDDAIVKVLLEKGANINLTDHSGQNALHLALQNSKVNMRVIKLLIEKGIDTKAKDTNGTTPLHFCCREGHYDALIMLLSHLDTVATKKKKNLLHTIFRQHKSNKHVMSSLISRGADVNVEDFLGRTPLHYTCYYNFYGLYLPFSNSSNPSTAKIIPFLLENGANINAKNWENRSVLYYAVNTKNYNCVKVLLDHDADINAVCDSGRTVLHVAVVEASSPDIEIIQLLLSRGVDANKRDENQKTALDYAVTRSASDDMVKILYNASIVKNMSSC